MENRELIEKFYSAFADGDSERMVQCYHDNIVFEDPAFGVLEGSRAGKMWQMLLSQKKAATKITFSNVQSNGQKGSADWTAEYFYGPKRRRVLNHIRAEFKFKDGKIIDHRDHFDLWKWSRQALGPAGTLLGWTPLIKNKIRTTANKRLDEFIEKT